MIARGDLGVELSPQEVPTIQKKLILNCRKVGKPVIVATQMLESMINLPLPSRAEASDVAGAVFDGADAVMLSAETSIGNYPEEAITYMNSIIKSSEDHIKKFPNDGPSKLDIEESNYHAVAQATVDLSEKIKFYSNNDKLRKKIAMKGQKKYFKLFNERRITKYFIDISTGKDYNLF